MAYFDLHLPLNIAQHPLPQQHSQSFSTQNYNIELEISTHLLRQTERESYCIEPRKQ
jgi:hypothetical protein